MKFRRASHPPYDGRIFRNYTQGTQNRAPYIKLKCLCTFTIGTYGEWVGCVYSHLQIDSNQFIAMNIATDGIAIHKKKIIRSDKSGGGAYFELR